MEFRRYGASREAVEIPDLTVTQRKFYKEFLQRDVLPEDRVNEGMQEVFREIFPISSYDGRVSLDFLYYDLGEPRHTPDECRQLRLSYAAPLKIRVRLNRDEPVEEDVYLGAIPLMIGGGEFIINGAERVIVTQIQRSPGSDFFEEIHPSGKRLHSCRIIPERGSWIQMEVTSKDLLTIRIDRSGRMMATVLLRALSEKFSTDRDILRAFYKLEKLSLRGFTKLPGKNVYSVEEVANPETGEVIVEACELLTLEIVEELRGIRRTSIEVIVDPADTLIISAVREDESSSHEDAVLRLYARMRPGNPAQIDKAKDLFEKMFLDDKRYNLGKIGRYRLNRKFRHKVSEDIQVLTAEDYYEILKYFYVLRAGKGQVDDIDHLANRRVRTIKNLVTDEFRKGMVKLRRAVRERLSLKDISESTPRTLINSQTVASSIEYFFARGELSHVVDQSNPLSQLTHERRLSALGPGGLNRKRAGFEVRDVHPSHYGRICPIETPEGTGIGLLVSLSIYAAIDRYGFLVTPYLKVKEGRISRKIAYLHADEEAERNIAQSDVKIEKTGKIVPKQILVRHREEFKTVGIKEVEYIDVSPKQLVGISAALIPFLEHDDANRALMGSNMQRQAVPLLKPQAPLISTGIEPYVARNSGMLAVSPCDGTVEYADGTRIAVKEAGRSGRTHEFALRKYIGLNERTCLNQTPIVRTGDDVKSGQVLTEGVATAEGELALGRNVLVAFMSWEGCNFEDAILVSERLLKQDAFTSVHIEEFTIEIRETKLGREEITRDIPNVSEAMLANLDGDGLVRIGTRVNPGDILVGKIAPKSKSELTSEEKLLHAIFGRAGEDVKNDSLEVKPGCDGWVIDVQRFSRRSPISEDEKRQVRKQVREIEGKYDAQIADVVREKFAMLKKVVGGRLRNEETGEIYRVTMQDADSDVVAVDKALDLDKIKMHPATRRKAKRESLGFDKKIMVMEVQKERRVGKVKRGDELPSGVLELVKVYVAVKRKLSVGDKMAGRHGNKGVVARILPEEDMPFLADGTPVDMVLNPLGVPSRMNFGQILETHLGWAAHELGFRAVTPVFDGANEADIRKALNEAGLPEDGKTELLDGRTGQAFDQKVTVGYIYMMKLHHLVADKVHARATGPYSLITQQPLGGKARNGGQRLGEMEVWALEAYGAANILQEFLTVKSDDVEGRTKIYESMVKGENSLEPGTPISFEVLCNEIKGLGLNMKLEKTAREKALETGGRS